MIQAVAIAEMEGHNSPNAYGHLPLVDLDPTRPATKDGPDNDYWDHVDFIVERANALGLTVGFLPTWGHFWHDRVHSGKPLFDEANAATYGMARPPLQGPGPHRSSGATGTSRTTPRRPSSGPWPTGFARAMAVAT